MNIMDDKEAVKIVEDLRDELLPKVLSSNTDTRIHFSRQVEAINALLAKQVAVDEMLAKATLIRFGVTDLRRLPGGWRAWISVSDQKDFESPLDFFAALQAKEKENNG